MDLATATGHDSDINQLTAEQIGGVLAFARREKSMSVAFVAAELRIPKAYIQAIESSDYSGLPGVAYIPGYLRSYSKLLDIDPTPLVAAYLNSLKVDDVKPKYVFPEQVLTPKMAGSAIAMFGVIIALAGYVGWFLFERPISDVDAPQEVASASRQNLAPDLPEGLSKEALGDVLAPPVLEAPQPDFEIADDRQAGPVSRPDNLEQLALPEGTNRTVLASVREAAEASKSLEAQSESVGTVSSDTSASADDAGLKASSIIAEAPDSNIATETATLVETDISSTNAMTSETELASTASGLEQTLSEQADLNASQGPASANATVADPNSEILIKAVSASWVEIVRDNGEIVVSKLLRSGDVLAATIEDDLFLSTGNAGGLTLETAALEAFRVGKVGEILRDFPLTMDMLRDRQVQSEN